MQDLAVTPPDAPPGSAPSAPQAWPLAQRQANGGRLGAYTLPAHDPAPWYDPKDHDSQDFAGVSVLSMVGHEDSTWTGTATERSTRGGFLLGGRHTYREVTVRALLVGADHAGAQYGLRWLTETLLQNGDPSRDKVPGCQQSDATFYSVCPVTCDDHSADDACTTECVWPYQRWWYDVALEFGPIVLDERETNTGGYWMEVEWVWLVGNPHTWSRPVSAADSPDYGGSPDYQYLKDNAARLYPSGTYQKLADTRQTYQELRKQLWNDWIKHQAAPAPAAANLQVRPGSRGSAQSTGPYCYQDPDCFPVPQMPLVPQEPDPCSGTAPTGWTRATVALDRDDIERMVPWTPSFSLTATGGDYRDVRIRFTPLGGDPDSEYVVEYWVTWLPHGGTLNLCGARDRITLDCGGRQFNGEHLVRLSQQTDATRWPLVRPNDGVLLTIDVPTGQDADGLDINVLMLAREAT